ncbi:hypothetical protein BDV96DRAFT_596999 [Lophiotrema nucula]|uniref:LCCL domain-containing protein n=1 Tax=Lophiotrema nucula TaxID=690887 RepID=A0A6A5ZFW7_9PLEO|nr:hypothetical protein BDV96DRAFT_596999 [Lophiotrema nucula]
MAAPADRTIKELDGKWILNKSISDSVEPVLALQGIGWLTRKAIGLATVTQHLRTTTEATDPPATTIVIEQTVTGGLKGTTEKRTLDWQWRAHSDHLFGDLRGRSRYTTLSAILTDPQGSYEDKAALDEDAKFLVGEEGTWLEETKEGEVVESYVENEGKGWTGWQIWGFGDVKGERWLVRRFAIRKGKEVVRVRLVYEWAGPHDS